MEQRYSIIANYYLHWYGELFTRELYRAIIFNIPPSPLCLNFLLSPNFVEQYKINDIMGCIVAYCSFQAKEKGQVLVRLEKIFVG